MKAMRSAWLSVMMSGLGFTAALPAFGGGAFSASDPLGNGNLDASVGLSAAKTYTHAYNIRGGDVTVNGVLFTGVDNFTGVDGSFTMSGWSSIYGPDDGGRVIGAGSGLNTLLSTFNYNGSMNLLTLTNLVAGQTYILTFYNKAWLAAGNDRVLAVTSSSGAATTFDENMGGDVNANLLRYTFTASGDSEWVKFVTLISGTMHFYGFTTEQAFANAWSGGADWTTATWGAPGVPNGPGANAVFAAQGAPTAINLDGPVTVGHIQFDGANAWTVSGANPLTLQADVGGVSVLSTPSGSHTISSDITLNNDLMKEGVGSLTLAGTVSGSGAVSVNAGTLEITAAETLPVSTAVEIAAGAFLKLSNASTQTVTVLTFGGALQHRGTWGAEGSGAQYTSSRFTGTGVLRVLAGSAVGVFTASGDLGGGDLDASVGLDSGATYFAAVNVFGGALTINGVPFAGSAGANPSGLAYTTDNFGNVHNSAPQSTVTGNLGLLLNDFNYGNGTTPQAFTLRNLIAGRTYVLTFYNRVWGAYADRTQNITTTSGATTTFNEDNGAVDTANWLRYTFIASGAQETITMTPVTSGNGYHFYGFSVSTEPAGEYADVTRRNSGAKVIADSLLSDVRIVEGTGTVGDITLGAATTTINSLTQSATEDVATINAGNGILALNSLLQEVGAGGLTINNGLLKIAGTGLIVDTLSPNPVTVNAVIANGTGASTLAKTGAGTLTLTAPSGYLGGTAVYGGTLRIMGSGTVGGGPLTVNGGTLQVDGGSVYPNWGDAWRVRIVNGTVNQTAGWLGYGGYVQVLDSTLNLSGGTFAVGLENLLGFENGANTTVNISGSHVSDWYVTRFEAGLVTLNLLSGGTLYTDQIFSRGGAGTIRFDGGKLGMNSRDPNRTPGDWISVVAGSLTLNVEDGGAIIDTAAGSATINRPFLRDGASTGGLTKTGGNTLTLTALSTYAGDTQVQGGTLKLAPVPALDIINAGFELPAYGPGGWSYLGGDGVPGGWTITAGGIARSGAPWVSTAPQGVQIGYLQGSSTFTQTITVPVAGTYRLSFSASNRPDHDADHLAVQIDGVPVISLLSSEINNGGAFKSYSVDLGTLSAGPHELKFVGTSPGGDTATAIDDVQIIQTTGNIRGTLPIGTRVAISAGATLELNGASQTLAGLGGSGRVVNSTLTNVTLTVGGDNASTSFGGTIEGAIDLAKVGGGTLTLSADNTYGGATLVKEGTLQLPPIGAAADVPNASFETHAPLENIPPWNYSPGGAEWAFGAAGIAAPGSPWVNGGAGIDGTVAGFIQNAGTITGTITVPSAGMYSLAFLAGKRPGLPATQLFVDVDGANKLMFPESALGNEIGDPFAGDLSLSGGTHTLTFRGVTTTGDNCIWIDRIALTSLGGSLPTGTVVTVSAGAVLDLNGNAQALTGLSGDGLVTNGTLSVSGTIAPGGTNVIGTLTLATSAALSGTLLIDVASDGTCDLLKVQGSLDITGLTLQIQDVNQFKSGSQDVIATFAPGGLTGRFASTNLGTIRMVVYNNAAGEVRLVGSGLLFMLK